MNNTIRIALILTVAALQYRCAQESAPLGGKKDTEAPKIRSISPANESVNFSSREVNIKFNEFIQDNGFPQTLVSPPVAKQPTYRANGKTVHIKFNTQLKPNTTYTINFSDDIKDINEGNPLSNFTYVFSTGSYIDTGMVSGKVKPANAEIKLEGVMVLLYPQSEEFSIRKDKPVYFAKVDASGNFTIRNIKSGSYEIFALKDQNLNYLYDQPNELIGFSDRVIEVDDTLKTEPLEITLFQEKASMKLQDARSIQPGHIRIVYNERVKSIRIDSKLNDPENIYTTTADKDSVDYWFNNLTEKKAEFYLVVNDTVFDTLRMELKTIKKDTLFDPKKYTLTVESQQVTGLKAATIVAPQSVFKPLKLFLSRPCREISDSIKVQITEDSTTNISKYEILHDTADKRIIYLSFEKKEGAFYEIIFPDSMFKDVLGFYNVLTTLKFKADKKDEYGNVNLIVSNAKTEKHYIIKLKNSRSETVSTVYLHSSTEQKFSIKFLPADSYYLVVIEDTNENNKWDTGSFVKRTQPEKLTTYDKKYQLKGGWDLDIDFKIEE